MGIIRLWPSYSLGALVTSTWKDLRIHFALRSPTKGFQPSPLLIFWPRKIIPPGRQLICQQNWGLQAPQGAQPSWGVSFVLFLINPPELFGAVYVWCLRRPGFLGVCSTEPAFREPSETFSSVLLALLFCEEESKRGARGNFLKNTHKPSLLARTMADRNWPKSQGMKNPLPPPTTPGPVIPGSL